MELGLDLFHGIFMLGSGDWEFVYNATACVFWQALVDAPDMVRGQMNFKRLSLTDIKIDIPRVPKKKTLIDAMEKAGRYSVCVLLKSVVFSVFSLCMLIYIVMHDGRC